MKKLTKEEEKAFKDNILLYFTGGCFLLFVLIVISPFAAALIRGIT